MTSTAIAICDVMTLTCIELKHEQSKLHNAVLGVVNMHGQTKSTISSIHGPWLALRSKEESFFFEDSDSLNTLTTCYDAYISRFASFLWTTTITDRQTDYFTPCAYAHGVIE